MFSCKCPTRKGNARCEVNTYRACILTHIQLTHEAREIMVLEVSWQKFHRERRLIFYNETMAVLKNKLSTNL